MDFIERLVERVNQIPNLEVHCRTGYLGTDESLVVYPMPGSQVTRTYMDGTTEQRLNFEFAMKSKSQRKIGSTLWSVQNTLENLEELESDDNSFEFLGINITDKPYIDGDETQGWIEFGLNIRATITVLKGDN